MTGLRSASGDKKRQLSLTGTQEGEGPVEVVLRYVEQDIGTLSADLLIGAEHDDLEPGQTVRCTK